MAELSLPPAKPLRGYLLWGAFVPVALLVIGLALVHPALAGLPVVALAALPVVWWVFQRPLLNLCVVLAGFVLIVDHSAGVQPQEVLYGLYFLLFIGHWLITRAVVYRSPILETVVDKAVLLFVLGLTLSVLWAPLYGATPFDIINDWRTIFMVAIYFPVREACVRYHYAVPALLLVLLGLCLYVATRNILNYQAIIARAIYSYQVGRGRVIMNDALLMVAATCTIVWAVFAENWRPRLLLLAAYMICLTALILTQSRTYWVTHLLAVLLLFLLAPGRARYRLLVGGVAGSSLLLLAGSLFMGKNLPLIAASFANRMLTVKNSTAVDISFLSRLYESEGALQMIKFNPVLGYGPANTFTFTDILNHVTNVSNFVHIGYVGMLFSFGVWGVVAIMTFWLAAVVVGFRAYYTRAASATTRIAGLTAALCLTVLLLSNYTSPLFELDDATFMMGVLVGLASGAWLRARREAADFDFRLLA